LVLVGGVMCAVCAVCAAGAAGTACAADLESLLKHLQPTMLYMAHMQI